MLNFLDIICVNQNLYTHVQHVGNVITRGWITLVTHTPNTEYCSGFKIHIDNLNS